MNRIPILTREEAPSSIANLYDGVKRKLGVVPNMVQALGNSATGLQSYLALSGAVSEGTLDTRLREKIALRVAELNDCEYCLSAHTAIGGLLKVPAEELEAAQAGVSTDRREQAVLDLVEAIVETRGKVSNASLEAARSAGVDDGQITEIVANVALNVFTNYFNRLAQTEIDFPRVHSLQLAAI